MEETKNSYIEAPDTESPKQEYHKKDKKKNHYSNEEGKGKEEISKVEEIVEIETEAKAEADIEEISTSDFSPVEEKKPEIIKPIKKNKGKVVLVGKATISVQDKNGNNITIRGHRDDVKIGDIIEY